jgi:hypothetical protein
MKKQSRNAPTRYVVCLRNDGYPESLELRKLYRVLPDPKAHAVDHVRVIDESGEDYLYPKEFFAPVTVSEPIKRALAAV